MSSFCATVFKQKNPAIGTKRSKVSVERYYWYDSSGRVAQCYEEFPDGETLRTSYRYGIQGNVLKTMQTCTKDNASVWTVSTYRYDHRGRLASVSRSFSETSHLDDITYGYDELGHPASRSCGGKISETQTYDIRGWNESLTASRGSNVLFGETLRYSSPESSQSEGQHNGNITEITSSHYGMAQETVSYFYDNLNRLHDAKHYTGSLSSPDNNYTERNITYDRNGNVLSMTRSQTSPQNITMTYDGNRLSSYCDSEQFTYDSNGNCSFDPTTGLEYSCNFLNLPCTVLDGEEMRLHYTYFADGTKYSAMCDFNEGYVYVGPFVYKIHSDYDYPFLESVSSEEGRLVYDESSRTWHDCWFTKDHIGNVRTVLDLSKSASAPLSDIIVEQDSYLPFGTKSANPALFGSDNRYRLCGNEEQHLFGFTTTLTDFGARSYNPTICRWMMIDPLAEKYYGMSPYNYCGNNPVVLVDPDGYEPTPKEAAAMAESAYQDVKEKRQPFLDKILSDGNWTVSYKQQDDEYGLKYVVYERANADGSKEYVCAFAGTDPFPLNKDPKQDVKQLAGKSEQYGKAVTKASELSQSLGESTELTFVGHSLGGGLAAASSMKTGKKAITFNSAALSVKTIDALNLGNDSSNIVNYVAFGPMPNGSFRPEILNHIQNVSLPGKTYNVLQFFPIHKMKRMTNTLSK